MDIYREPKITLIARQVFQDHPGIQWSTDTEVPAERLVEFGGRVCYMSYGKGRKTNREYIAHIIESGHGSVLEHAQFSFCFEGISRSLTHELIRHRAGFAYSQLSQRYVDESYAAFIEPDDIADDPELHAKWLACVEHCQKTYTDLVEALMKKNAHVEAATDRRKLSRQAARSVLPNATETKIIVTANARAWRHFIELRGSAHADVEIRKLAVGVLRILQKEAPSLFGDYTIAKLADGSETTDTPHRKV
ncbi:MAG: FAD-dependent thymidylate synthase [Deltaproteobacteria bacterium]|nr:FAD-dependent thymidylate synthase [Deltaproteobacteria bacterium]